MKRQMNGIRAALSALCLLAACDRNDVAEEVEDLQEARAAAPEEASAIEAELKEAKQRVVMLEKKLALARQGVTDEVVEERAELAAELEEQEAEVSAEVAEAADMAAEHNKEADMAQRALSKGKRVTNVDAKVTTTTNVKSEKMGVKQRTVDAVIPVEKTETKGANRVESD